MSKKIVFCADGTWNTPHGPAEMPNDTNVRKFFLLLNDDASQLKYYDSGVGTNGSPFEHFFGGTMGDGLFQKVQDGYAFLSWVWDPGDEIYLLGFSRGAYTARSLCGMLAGFGVPTKNLDNQTVPKIFSAYRTTGQATRAAMKAQLTEQYAMTGITIRMVGVWDTVGALGIPGQLFSEFDQANYGFLDTTLSQCVQNAYHAISLDERRAPFSPTLWSNPDGSPRANDAQMTQVWFPGVHCDVGGSYEEEELANITLQWMIGNAKTCGLAFDDTAVAAELAKAPFDPAGKQHESWQVVPWGMPKNRVAPANAVLSNTVAIRAQKMGYKPLALSQPINTYATMEVIPAAELQPV
jgi:uncharacterized protein (DUF2235 family)